MNCKGLIAFLKSYEPNFGISGEDSRLMRFEFDSDSIFKNEDAVIQINSPELFQMLAPYLYQFWCIFEYKNSKIRRIGDVFCAEHYAKEIERRFDINVLDFTRNEDLVDFIIYLNDKCLPVERPDDSPIRPNPFDRAMSLAQYGYTNLSPLIFDSYEDWMDEVEATADDKPDIFLVDDDDNIINPVWVWARKDAEERVIEWFNAWQDDCTFAMVTDALKYLQDCGLREDSESIQDLLEKLAELGVENALQD